MSRSLFGLGPRGDCPLPNTGWCPLKSDVVAVVVVATAAETRLGADTTLGFVDITDIGEDRLNLYTN